MSLTFATGQFLTGQGGNVTLPDGDWCLVAMVLIPDNNGVRRHTVMSAAAVTSVNEITFGVLKLQDPGGYPGSALLRVYGASGEALLRAASPDVPVNKWFLLVGQRTGGDVEVWTVEFGATSAPVLYQRVTVSLGAVAPGTPMMIGRRYCDQIVDDDFKGSIAYVARANAALSAAQMVALARGAPPQTVAPWVDYLPFLQAGQTTYKSSIGGVSYAVTGYPTLGKQPMRLW